MASTASNASLFNVSVYQTYGTSCSVSSGVCNGVFLNGADYGSFSNVSVVVNTSSTNSPPINIYSGSTFNVFNGSYAYSRGSYGLYVYSSTDNSLYDSFIKSENNSGL